MTKRTDTLTSVDIDWNTINTRNYTPLSEGDKDTMETCESYTRSISRTDVRPRTAMKAVGTRTLLGLLLISLSLSTLVTAASPKNNKKEEDSYTIGGVLSGYESEKHFRETIEVSLVPFYQLQIFITRLSESIPRNHNSDNLPSFIALEI